MSLSRLTMLLAVSAVCLPQAGIAQSPSARDFTPQVIAIRAGRLVDVERGEVRRDQLIVVRGDRIEAIQPGASKPPAGARVIDLSKHTVMPGLIDCHAHMIGDLTDTDALLPLQRSGAQEAFSGVRNARTTLMAGFTTVRDVGTYRALVDAALRDAIEDGTVVGPRMSVAGAYVTVTSGGGELIGAAQDVTIPMDYRFGVANSADEVRARVRALLNGGANFIKMIATGAVLTQGTKPGVSEYTEEQIRAAVEQAAEYGTYVTAHAHGAEGIKRAVRAGVRSIEHGSLIDDEGIALMKEKGAWLVADIYNGDYIASHGKEAGWPAEILRKNEETTEAQRAGFRKAVAAGVRIAYGTDSGVYPHRYVARQLPYMVRYGMTPIQAVRSATLSAAELIGWEDRIGSITAGKLADIVAVPGDALVDLRSVENVVFVMKGGMVYKGP
jgi:imidazolonepropionase-like amidohydrolase